MDSWNYTRKWNGKQLCGSCISVEKGEISELETPRGWLKKWEQENPRNARGEIELTCDQCGITGYDGFVKRHHVGEMMAQNFCKDCFETLRSKWSSHEWTWVDRSETISRNPPEKIRKGDRIFWECSMCKNAFRRESDYLSHNCHIQ